MDKLYSSLSSKIIIFHSERNVGFFVLITHDLVSSTALMSFQKSLFSRNRSKLFSSSLAFLHRSFDLSTLIRFYSKPQNVL